MFEKNMALFFLRVYKYLDFINIPPQQEKSYTVKRYCSLIC